MEPLRRAVLVAATIATGMMAGLCYAYAISFLPGLGRTDDRTFIAAMQQTNEVIEGGWLFVIFLGALVFTALAAALHLGADRRAALPWIVAGFVLYAATFVITVGANVPLNEELAAAGDPDRIADLAAVRDRFEAPWVRWHIARTVANVAAFGCLSLALLRAGRMNRGAGI